MLSYSYKARLFAEMKRKSAAAAALCKRSGVRKEKEYPYETLLKDDFPTDVYWIFGEMLTVVIQKDGGIAQGRHHVRLTLGTRRSYTPTMVSVCEKTLTFA